MSSSTAPSGRRRVGLGLLSLTVVGGLAGTAVATTGEAAVSAVPSGDCAAAYPVSDVHADDAVTGLTVTHGTVPESFSGTVLGVLDDGIAPGVDMVMVRLSNPDIDKLGIWAGMSGSPVYASDGRLIGAVAYGLASGPSTVAGVTPYEAMDDWLPATTVPVTPTAARTVARASGVRRTAAAQGFTALPTPLAVGGVGAGRLGALIERSAGHTWVSRAAKAAVPLGSAGNAGSAAGPDVSSIVAGGNLGASLSYGEVSMTALGTVTSVCDQDVVGFGHPVEWAGRTDLGLSPADALYVQDDVFNAFKVGNVGAPVGTITQDRGTGVTGVLGPLPTTSDVTTTVTYGDRSHTGVSHVVRRSPDNVATTTLMQVVGDHASVVDGPARGTEDASWTMSGTGPGGSPFSLTTGDLFSGRRDLSWPVGFTIGEMVYRLDRIPGVSVDAVTTTHDLTDGVDLQTLQAVQVRQGGAWTTLNRRHPLAVRGGQRLVARLVLTSGSGASRTVNAHLDVPRSYSGRIAALEIGAGESAASGRPPKTLEGFSSWVQNRVRNDEIELTLSRGPVLDGDTEGSSSGYAVVMGRMARAARAGAAPRHVSAVVGPLGSVVHGYRFGLVLVG